MTCAYVRACRTSSSQLRQARLAVTPQASVVYVTDTGQIAEVDAATGETVQDTPPMCLPDGATIAVTLPPLPLCSPAGWTEMWGAVVITLPDESQRALLCRCACSGGACSAVDCHAALPHLL